jgi:hypothetical protein
VPQAIGQGSGSDTALAAATVVGRFIWLAGDPGAPLSDYLLAETAVAVLRAAIQAYKRDQTAVWSAALRDLASLEAVRALFQIHDIDSGKIRSRSKTIGKNLYVSNKPRQKRKSMKRAVGP